MSGTTMAKRKKRRARTEHRHIGPSKLIELPRGSAIEHDAAQLARISEADDEERPCAGGVIECFEAQMRAARDRVPEREILSLTARAIVDTARLVRSGQIGRSGFGRLRLMLFLDALDAVPAEVEGRLRVAGMMPEGEPSPPAVKIIDELVLAKRRMLFEMLDRGLFLSEPRRRHGRPTPGQEVEMVVLYEVELQRTSLPASASDSRVFAAAAQALGPGLRPDHIRRVVERYRRLEAISPEARAPLESTRTAFFDLIREIRAKHPFRNPPSRRTSVSIRARG